MLQEFPAALFSCLLDAFFLILHPKGNKEITHIHQKKTLRAEPLLLC